jgi:DNA-3-methyladenine glycosylase
VTPGASPLAGAVPPRAWYLRDVLEVAPSLLGALLTTTGPDGEVTVRISEVEAYCGESDPGSHAYRGWTARNAVMFDEPGRLYVYRHLGLHHCVNIVVGPVGTASAVLIRAGEIVAGRDVARQRRLQAGVVRADVDLARGPARLTVALGIDLAQYGADVTVPGEPVVLRRPASGVRPDVATGPRVGVSGAGGDAERYPWRFWLVGDPTVSVYRASANRRRGSA